MEERQKLLSDPPSLSELSDYGSTILSTSEAAQPGPKPILKKQVTLIPPDPVTLSWKHLNVRVKKKKKEEEAKLILDNVMGIVKPGQLVALMGASGAGKTTLLNVLTFRNTGALEVEGDIRLNGVPADRKGVTAASAYVQQEDVFYGTLTVKEHLSFQAILRLGKELSIARKRRRVDEVIRELGLTRCMNTIIGIDGVFKGISGGEAKRLAFASSVLTNPAILFCDEPTTGLDAFMAESVVSTLQSLAAANKTVLCTIHQPASQVFRMFDRIILLAEGRVAFAGESTDALKLFESVGYPCPSDYNPADHYINTLAIEASAQEESRKRVAAIADAYASGAQKKELESDVFDADAQADDSYEPSKISPYKAMWIVQVFYLTWRGLINNFRNPGIIVIKIMQKIVLALFLGLLYNNNVINQRGIMNIGGATFFMLSELTYPALFGSLTNFPPEFPVVVREYQDGMYRISSFYMSKVLSNLPVYSVDGTIFLLISYFWVGLRPTAGAFFTALLICIIIEQASAAFGSMMSAIAPSLPIAFAIVGPIVTFLNLFGGLFKNVGQFPVWLSWVQYISWFRYGYEALEVNQWHAIKNITCEYVNTPCVTSGDEVISNLSFKPGNLWPDIGLMVALFGAFHLLGFIGLSVRVGRAR